MRLIFMEINCCKINFRVDLFPRRQTWTNFCGFISKKGTAVTQFVVFFSCFNLGEKNIYSKIIVISNKRVNLFTITSNEKHSLQSRMIFCKSETTLINKFRKTFAGKYLRGLVNIANFLEIKTWQISKDKKY